MTKEKFYQALTDFLNENSEFELYLLGTGNLLVQGIDVLPGDIDFLADRATVEAMATKLGLLVRENESGYIEIFTQFKDVNIQIVSNEHNPLRPGSLENQSVIVEIGDNTVKCMSLESEKYAYEKMGRDKDTNTIKLINKKIINNSKKE